MTPLRIGSGAGYSGDRIDPAQELAERGQLNALVFECLAERTIALAQLRRSIDPQQGYDPLLRERMHAVLPAATSPIRGTSTCPTWPTSAFRSPTCIRMATPWSASSMAPVDASTG